ncbi:hypothetical protein ACS0TY_031362 [Phlomoides rotata]
MKDSFDTSKDIFNLELRAAPWPIAQSSLSQQSSVVCVGKGSPRSPFTEENSAVSQHTWKSCFQSSLSREEQEQRRKQASGRAVFVQDLLVSTLLAD